jgi:hypothetical protein
MKNQPDQRAEADADNWFTSWKFAAILAGLIFICFPLVAAGFETFFFRDFGAFGYPLAFYQRECFWRGEIPFWNPYNFCGIPFLAQWNTLTFYPLSLFYLIFPLSWSLGVFNLGHLVIGGLGMYFLARRWTKNSLAACVAGIVFAFNGLSWHSLMWPNDIAGLGWMPWVLLTAERAWQTGGRALIWAALAGAMQMLTGAPEIIFLTWLATGAFWAVELIRNKSSGMRIGARFLCVVVWVAALAAAQLLPFLDFLAHSQRGANYNDTQLSMAMPLTGLLNYIVPVFHLLTFSGVFWQNQQFWTSSYYLGVGTIALALIALRLRPDWRTWTLAGLTAFSLGMALGESGRVYTVVTHLLPSLKFMRYPIKFVVLATLTIPLLAAQATGRLQSIGDQKWPSQRRKIIRLGTALVGVIIMIIAWEWAFPKQPEARLIVTENAAVRAVFLTLILGCVLAGRRVKKFKHKIVLRVCLILLLWFDVFTHMSKLNPTVQRAVFDSDSIRDFFKWNDELRPGRSRAFETREALLRAQYHWATDPSADSVADVNGRRLSLFADYNLLDHAAKLDGEYSLDTPQMEDLWLKLYWATNEYPHLYDFLGVALISNPTNAVAWLPRKSFLPLITAGQEPTPLPDAAALQAITNAAFEPSQSVYLEPNAAGQITARQTSAKILSAHFAAEKISAEVEAAAPAMVVIAQSYYHDWHAFVDGQPTRLWRANYAFQALEIPAGRHDVQLVYQDAAFKWGAVISLTSLAVLIGGFFLLRKQTASPAI